MDVALFLSLPIDIRKLVYFHLDGQFCHTGSETIQELYFSNVIKLPAKGYNPSKRQSTLRKRLYPFFECYLGIFEYSPSLVDNWLEYCLWLRYDCVVLDCMRLNHLYEGELIGPVDLIYLDGRVRLAYFDKYYMLWNWYTYREYARWIEDENGQAGMTYLRLNLEYLKYSQVDEILHHLQRDNLLEFVIKIRFEQEHEDETSETPEEQENDDFESISYRIADPATIRVVQSMEAMKGLNHISVRGNELYEGLINFHGVRDNPGKTINYMVKKRILCIELLQAGSICRTGVADFTRWENLRELSLIRVGDVDLNKLMLPPKCRLLTIVGVPLLHWWDVVDRIERMMGKCFATKAFGAGSTLKLMSHTAMDADEVVRCQTIVKDCFAPLNYMKLHDIYAVKGNKIVVPGVLFHNRRILLDPHVAREIIIV